MVKVIVFFHDKIWHSLYASGELANECQEIFCFRLKKNLEDIPELLAPISSAEALAHVEEIRAKLNCIPKDILAVISGQNIVDKNIQRNIALRTSETGQGGNIFLPTGNLKQQHHRAAKGISEGDLLAYLLICGVSTLTLFPQGHDSKEPCLLQISKPDSRVISPEKVTYCPSCRQKLQISPEGQGLLAIASVWQNYLCQRNNQIGIPITIAEDKSGLQKTIRTLNIENDEDIKKLIEIALKSPYPGLKCKALSRLKEADIGDNDMKRLVKILVDDHESVRLAALDAFKESWDPTMEREIAGRYLLDEKKAVSKRAKMVLNTYKGYSTLRNIKTFSQDMLEQHYSEPPIRSRVTSLITEIEAKLKEPTFLRFEIAVDRKAERSYFLKLNRGPEFLGDLSDARVEMSFTQEEWDYLQAQIETLEEGTESSEYEESDVDELEENLEALGSLLYNKLFVGKLHEYFQTCRQIVDYTHNFYGIHLSLRIQAQELKSVPWNLLYDEKTQKFIARDARITLSLFLDIPGQPFRSFGGSRDINILAILSEPEPKDLHMLYEKTGLRLPKVETKKVELNLETELKNWHKHSDILVEVDIVRANMKKIRDKMRDRFYQYDVVHFFGHGYFDGEDACLVFERDSTVKDGDIVHHMLRRADEICSLLEDNRHLQIVILNSCLGAAMSPEKPFCGLAEKLLMSGIPSVIAMLYPIRKRTAMQFTRIFYRELARTRSVRAAFSIAQKEIALAQPAKKDFREWAAPVLFMRKKPMF